MVLPNGDDDGVIKVSAVLRCNTDYDFTCMYEREWWRLVITAYHHHHCHRFFPLESVSSLAIYVGGLK